MIRVHPQLRDQMYRTCIISISRDHPLDFEVSGAAVRFGYAVSLDAQTLVQTRRGVE